MEAIAHAPPLQERLLLISAPGPQEERLRKHFEACGFHVEVVCSSESAVSALRAGDVHLVLLTDTNTATSACSDVMALSATLSSVPLLHLQCSDDYARRAFSLRLGSDDVVSTPFALDEWMPAFMPCYGDPRWVLDTWMVN